MFVLSSFHISKFRYASFFEFFIFLMFSTFFMFCVMLIFSSVSNSSNFLKHHYVAFGTSVPGHVINVRFQSD